MKTEEFKQPVWEHEDHAVETNKASLTQSLILFPKDAEFPRGKANVITFYGTKPLKWRENGLHLIQASLFQEAHSLRQVKYLHGPGISFLLGLGNELVQHHPIIAYQRLDYLLTLSTERNAYYGMHVATAEARQSSEHSRTIVGNKGDPEPNATDSLQQLNCKPVNEGKKITGKFNITSVCNANLL